MEVLLLPNVNVCGLFFWIRDFPLYINKVLWLISQILFIRTSQIFYLFIFFVQYALRRRPQWCNGYSQLSVWKCFFFFVPLKPPENTSWVSVVTEKAYTSLVFFPFMWSPHLPGLSTATYHFLSLGLCWRHSQFQNNIRIPSLSQTYIFFVD